jgi:hypothetical protein
LKIFFSFKGNSDDDTLLLLLLLTISAIGARLRLNVTALRLGDFRAFFHFRTL